MSQLEDTFYDDQDAVKFIKNFLPQELKEKYTDDEIIYVTDLMFEYVEREGFLEEDEFDIDVEDLLDFIIKNSKRDGFSFEREEVVFVIDGEFAYEDSLV